MTIFALAYEFDDRFQSPAIATCHKSLVKTSGFLTLTPAALHWMCKTLQLAYGLHFFHAANEWFNKILT